MMSRLIFSTICLIFVSAVVFADTLILRDGTRIQGQLISVRNDIIEFEERRGTGRGRILEFDRDEVIRIEFDMPRGRGSSAERPFGMRERTAIVNARTPWTDTSVDVRAGQTIYFEASGEIRWGRDRRDGPGGEDNSPMNPARPLPTRSGGALIAKIGRDSEDYFFVGDETGPIRIRSTGRLFLGINDDFLNDNSGSFRVVIYH